MNHKIILAGGSGFLGGVLSEFFAAKGSAVVILTRKPKSRTGLIREVRWDGETVDDWQKELEGARALINLAGISVNCRYHARNRKLMLDSRLNSTRVLAQAIGRCKTPPPVWLNSSTATIYKHNFGPAWDETGEIGGCAEAKDVFSVHVATEWEREFFHPREAFSPLPRGGSEGKGSPTREITKRPLTLTLSPSEGERRSVPSAPDAPDSRLSSSSATAAVRKVALRSAMVLGHGSNSVLPNLLRLTRLGLGGSMAGGRQFVSWIHQEDFSRAVEWIIEHESLSGPVNLAAPNPVTNAEFMGILCKVCRRPFGLPASRWLLELGAFFLRTETELIIKSRRVVPGKLLTEGFVFLHPQLLTAVGQLISQQRKARS